MFSRLEHELRSPVAHLKGAIDNITTGDAETSEMLATISEQRNNLEAVLVKMILMISSSRAPEAAVNLRACLLDIEKDLWKKTRDPSFELRSSEHGLTVTGIAEQLRSAFEFVIKNALE